MTSQEPHTEHIADQNDPDTDVIMVAQPAPVFVDSTGRRRRLENGVEPVSDENATAPAHAEAHAALAETTAEQPLVRAATREARPVLRQVTAGRAKVPGQGVAPVLDSWPSILPTAPARHPAAGRATARPPLAGGVPGQATATQHRPGPRGPVPADRTDTADDDSPALELSTSAGGGQLGEREHDVQ